MSRRGAGVDRQREWPLGGLSRRQLASGGATMTLLDIDGVSHWYDARSPRPVLDQVSLSIASSETVALVGESGCGKSTLGRLVAGLAEPTRGRIRYDGVEAGNLRGAAKKAWRRSVQLIQQDPFGSLNPGITIGSTLGSALVYHKLVSRRQLHEELLTLVAQVGLDPTRDFLQRYPHQLSGGQRQRVAIARAVSLRPKLVVADEVTSMLDVSMRVAVLDLLRSFQVERQIAYLFISHDLGTVRYFATGGRVVVMFYGVIVEVGPTEEVIFHPRHPYTDLLLRAIPVPDPTLATQRDAPAVATLDGGPASEGCVFANRCPFVEARCRASVPPLVDDGMGHRSACFFPEKVAAEATSVHGVTLSSGATKGERP
ncbi:MAG: oligopeptide/dipeptide ABC transporter ATP-binding protein [Acidimicrobiales bacterium]